MKPIEEQNHCPQREGTVVSGELEWQPEESREEQSQHRASSVGHRWELEVGSTEV